MATVNAGRNAPVFQGASEVVIVGSVFRGNSAVVAGGGALIQKGRVDITHTRFDYNWASTTGQALMALGGDGLTLSEMLHANFRDVHLTQTMQRFNDNYPELILYNTSVSFWCPAGMYMPTTVYGNFSGCSAKCSPGTFSRHHHRTTPCNELCPEGHCAQPELECQLLRQRLRPALTDCALLRIRFSQIVLQLAGSPCLARMEPIGLPRVLHRTSHASDVSQARLAQVREQRSVRLARLASTHPHLARRIAPLRPPEATRVCALGCPTCAPQALTTRTTAPNPPRRAFYVREVPQASYEG